MPHSARPGRARRAARGSYHSHMSTPDLLDCLDAAREGARRGAAVLESWRARFSVREKARADLVTEADLNAQEAVRGYLLGRFPGHGFLGEEGGQARPPTGPSAPPTWI